MKKLFKALFSLCVTGFSKIYTYRTHMCLKRYRNILYSMWIKRLLKKCGKGFTIQAPIYLIGPQYICIGDGFGALERFRLECWDSYAGQKFTPKISIGEHVAFGYNVHIGCINEIKIGNNVLLASNIFIEDCYHGFADSRDIGVAPLERKIFSKGPVIIEDNVWIGENVAIMPNVTIGENSIIGANSVVTKSIPSFSVAAGNPARVIRSLKEHDKAMDYNCVL